jgi:hypothetical protein
MKRLLNFETSRNYLIKFTGHKLSLLLPAFLILFVLKPDAGISQGFTWITPNKTYLKLSVVEDATYRVSRSDFTNAGINVSNIDPRTVKMYNKGVEIPILFQGESDGTFDATDYIDFYGTRNYGGPTKYYTVDNTPYYQKDEYYDMYSDTNVYWIGWDGADGIRLANYSYTSETPYSIETFTERFHFEKDKVLSQGERAGSSDFRYFNNELFQGEGWYWSNMYTGLMITDTFSTPNLPVTPTNCSLNFFAYPSDVNYYVYNEHRIIIYINSTIVGDYQRDDFTRFNSTMTFSSSLLNTGSVNYVKAFYQATGYDGHTYLDYIDIKIPRVFTFRAGQLSAALTGSDTTSKLFTVTGYSIAAPLFIYDFKNNLSIKNSTISSDTLKFTAKSNSKLEIFNKTISKKPFKIIQRQVPDLVSSSNGADYVIVYHSMFETQAQQLADYRASHDGFRVTKANIRDIYDIFNYGIESPLALRLFAKNVYDNWPTPRFKYLCLLGRGTLDPKKNSVSTLYEKNLVPVYGNPTTDSYFANYNIGGFTYLDQVAIGRLPAYTVSEAQVMVDNIISYESKAPDSWMKNVLFVVGGGTASDQAFNQSLIMPFISNYVNPPPLSANDHRAFRVDSTTTVTYNYKDSVRRDINSGDLIVNFQGHAGFQNWEDAMQEPSTLDNYGKLPFVWSMTCYTGKTADNTARIFGEKFVTLNNRGAIGFLGSTGWGFVYSGNEFQNHLYYAFVKDTVRRTGDIIKYGKSKIAYDSVGSVTRHTINCYGLIGDPAVKLSIPVRPEFNIENDGYRLTDDFPSLNQTVTLTAFPFNYGLHADSCKIAFTLKAGSSTVTSMDTVIRSFKYSDSVRFTFRIDSIQNYSVQVELDKDNWVPLEDKTNNVLVIDMPLKNNSFVQLRPVDYEALSSDTVEFIGLNPLTDGSVKVLLQVDTSQSFSSPLLITFANDQVTGLRTSFKTGIPLLDTNVVYFWRTNSIISGDTTGWTNARSFSYYPALNSDSKGSRSSRENLNSGSPSALIRKFRKTQFAAEELTNTTLSDTGIGLTKIPLNLYVRSMGSSGAEISVFYVNDKAINIDGGRSCGLNLAKVRKVDGKILAHNCYKLFNTGSMDSVVNFLNTFDTTHYLLAFNASYVDYSLVQPLNENTKAKIRSFGSTKIDSMYKFGYFDTWSFIGYPGASQSNVSEQYFKYTSSAGWRESQSTINTTCLRTSGSISNLIGTAHSWQSFSWNQTLVPDCSIRFDVFGIDKSGARTQLMSDLTSNTFNDLSSVNAAQYPGIDLYAKIAVDTNLGLSSSSFRSLNASYTLPSELIFERTGIELSDSIASVGKELKVKFTCSNVGYQDVFGFVVNSYKSTLSSANLIKSDTAFVFIPVDSSARLTTKFTIPYYRARGDGKIPIVLEVLPVDGSGELYTYNNSLKLEIPLYDVSTSQRVKVFSDGMLLKGGEQVRSKPEIRIDLEGLRDNDMSRVSSRRFDFKINGLLVSANSSIKSGKLSKKDELSSARTSNNPDADPYTFHPELKNGVNRLTIAFTSSSGATDSASYDVFVSDQLSVTDLYNFPNPMKDNTSFMFRLAGSDSPGKISIKIYTSAGRMIKHIRTDAQIGDNIISWDGRDDDGDFISNGTYIYKLIIEGEEAATAVQKLVVLR